MKVSRKRKRSPETIDNKKEKEDSPNFLLKLYQILENEEYYDIIRWSNDGKSFIVKNKHEFTDKVLGKYYKHNNFESFVRQLNMYDFHKERSNQKERVYQHKLFRKDQKDLIETIKRKKKREFQLNNDQALIEYNHDLQPKKVTKNSLDKSINSMMKYIKECNDRRIDLESKVEKLTKQNEDYILQNQQMLQEIVGKNEKNKQYETFLCFMYDLISKSKKGIGGDGKNMLFPEIKEGDMLQTQNYKTIQDVRPQNNLVELESDADPLLAFIDKYLENHNNKHYNYQFLKGKNDLPKLLASGDDQIDKTLPIPLSPIRKQSNPPMEQLAYSPNRRTNNLLSELRKTNNDTPTIKQSLSLNDELFKNSAMKQIKPQNTNYDILSIKSDDNNNNNPLPMEQDLNNISMHSKDLFYLDFNQDNNSEQGDIANDRKSIGGFFDQDTSIHPND